MMLRQLRSVENAILHAAFIVVLLSLIPRLSKRFVDEVTVIFDTALASDAAYANRCCLRELFVVNCSSCPLGNRHSQNWMLKLADVAGKLYRPSLTCCIASVCFFGCSL